MKKVFDKDFLFLEEDIRILISSYEKEGNLVKDDRNKLKEFKLNGLNIMIKSFKVPNLFNKIIYNFFRKGKAQRSFEHANLLISKGIKTPKPIGYFEEKSILFFKRSFYVCNRIEYDFSMRVVVNNLNKIENKKILKMFVKFTFDLHQKNVHFLDHSPGNTLVKIKNDKIYFYLIDLNRMEFKKLSIKDRLINFSTICAHNQNKELVELISNEYSNLIKIDKNYAFKVIWENMLKYNSSRNFKKKLKKYFKFFFFSKAKDAHIS